MRASGGGVTGAGVPGGADEGAAASTGPWLTSTSTGLLGSRCLPGGVNCSSTVSGAASSSMYRTRPSRSPTASSCRAASWTGPPRRRGTAPEPWLTLSCTIDPMGSARPGGGSWASTTPTGAFGSGPDPATMTPKCSGTIMRAASATVFPTRSGTRGCLRNHASRSAEAADSTAAPTAAAMPIPAIHRPVSRRGRVGPTAVLPDGGSTASDGC